MRLSFAHWRALCLLIAVFPTAWHMYAQSNPSNSGDRYEMRVSVDEVVLTFYAADAHGLPIHDLKLSEIHLLDNGKPPRKILVFDSLEDAPIRSGILLDTSSSIEREIADSHALALKYAQKLLQKNTDQAFAMDFGYISHLQQDWTSKSAILTAAIRDIRLANANPRNGTAIFDAVFRACYSQFGFVDHASSGNFLLLFSDGEDNQSNISLDEAVSMCQKSNTAIYAVRIGSSLSGYSTGPGTLQELASKTGGRVLPASRDNAEIDTNLRTIESEARNRYRLVYSPPDFQRDGSFHRIELDTPNRVATMQVRSGYFAPTH